MAPKPTKKCMQAMKSQNRPPDGPWADLGSGSGALAIALARALPMGTQVMRWSQIETANVCLPLQMGNSQKKGWRPFWHACSDKLVGPWLLMLRKLEAYGAQGPGFAGLCSGEECTGCTLGTEKCRAVLSAILCAGGHSVERLQPPNHVSALAMCMACTHMESMCQSTLAWVLYSRAWLTRQLTTCAGRWWKAPGLTPCSTSAGSCQACSATRRTYPAALSLTSRCLIWSSTASGNPGFIHSQQCCMAALRHTALRRSIAAGVVLHIHLCKELLTMAAFMLKLTGPLASSIHLLLISKLYGRTSQPCAVGHLHWPIWHLARPEINSCCCRKRSPGMSLRVRWMGALQGGLGTCCRSASRRGPCLLRADC